MVIVGELYVTVIGIKLYSAAPEGTFLIGLGGNDYGTGLTLMVIF